MQIVDKGVLDGSVMHNIEPSEFAKSTLYYTHNFGRFRCNNRYLIDRDFDDSLLLFYVIDGSLVLRTRGEEQKIVKNGVGIMDCKYPHQYYCDNNVDFLWLHFSGSSSQNYYNYLFNNGKTYLYADKKPALKTYFETLNSPVKMVTFDEHERSLEIQYLLSQLAESGRTKNNNFVIDKALTFINSHYACKIELNTLSDICNLSVSQFIRLFKTHTDLTPHEYILGYRLKQARFMLRSSDSTIEVISDKCGFNSASHFTRAFKSAFDITPSQYRHC